MLEVFNSEGRSLVTPNKSTLVVTEHFKFTSSQRSRDVNMGYNPLGLMFVRAPEGGTVGLNVLQRYSSADDRGWISVGGTVGSEYCVLRPATEGGAFLRLENLGLEAFSASGELEFTSRSYLGRIVGTATRPSTANGGAYPFNISIPPEHQKPWISAEYLLTTFKGVGEYDEYMGYVFARRTASGYQIDMSTSGHPDGPHLRRFDPLEYCKSRFYIAVINGL